MYKSYFATCDFVDKIRLNQIVLSCQPRVTVTFYLQLLSKTLTCSLHLSYKSIDHFCMNPILRIELILKWSIDSKSLITVNKT